ncbi:hypothetical protein Rsub_07516 [Raphidocelis subcapitata]|uniref:Protein kinase domain-containing protein n=1 Tax=Raphidocelis subcapitata TaxID=307507 RepID=A0A2V0PD38_9CHLO|nr:hypothetical protein Rsub_07516 [Raphidocelis subcapitata]|eukprot:GBF95015.1 hypothetical protein Rsub_07516 [Raphidocelis subcapitata]
MGSRRCAILLVAVLAAALAPAARAGAATAAAAPPPTPPCPAAGVLHADCAWRGGGGGAAVLVGAMTPRTVGGASVLTPPAVYGGGGAAAAAPAGAGGGLALTSALLVGFPLPDPASAPAGERLRPAGLLPPAPAAGGGGGGGGGGQLLLRDVRMLVTPDSLARHLAFFAPGQHNASGAANATVVYTDGSSFLHVNSWFDAHTTWQSVGLLVAGSLDEALATSAPPAAAAAKQDGGGSRRRLAAPGAVDSAAAADAADAAAAAAAAGKNYVIAADNATIVRQMEGRCGLETPAPLLVYLTSNITMSKPPVPKSGIDIARPLAMVGLASLPTSIDWAMQANQWIMAPGPRFRWAYVTLDSVVLENLGFGDARSAQIAKPLAVTYTLNLWPLYYERTALRNTLNNVTIVMSEKKDLDYMLYWLTIYRSTLPLHQKMAGFLRDGLGFTEWQLDGPIAPDGLKGVRLSTDCVRVAYSDYTTAPQVARPLPLAPVDPLIRDALSKGDGSAIDDLPLVVAISSAAGLADALSGDVQDAAANGLREFVIVLRCSVALAPNATAGWPPAGGQSVAFPMQLLGEGAKPTSNETLVALDFGYALGVLAIPDGAGRETLTIKRVRLHGLPQGPGAAEAARALDDPLEAPQLWTLLLWSVDTSTPQSILLDNCEVALPPQELAHLRARAARGRDFVVDLSAAGRRRRLRLLGPGGDGIERAGSITAKGAAARPDGSLHIDSLLAGAVKGVNITFIPGGQGGSGGAAPPPPFVWPGPDGRLPGGGAEKGGRQGPPPPWAAAVAGVGGAALAGGAVAGGAAAVRRRRRRRRRDRRESPPCKAVDAPSSGGLGSNAPSVHRGSGGDGAAAAAPPPAAGVQIATDRPLSLLGRPASDPGRAGGAAAAPAAAAGGGALATLGSSSAGSGDERDRWQAVQSTIAAMQQQILSRRLQLRTPWDDGLRSSTGGGVSSNGAATGPAPHSLATWSSPGFSSGGCASGAAFGTAAALPPLFRSSTGQSALPAAPAEGSNPLEGIDTSVLGLAALQQLPFDLPDDLPVLLPTPMPLPMACPTTAAAVLTALPSGQSLGARSSGGAGTGGAAGGASDSGSSGLALGQGGGAAPGGLQLLEVVGRGAFSAVYKAVWRGRFVAVKVLPLHTLSDIGAAGGAGGGGDLSFDRMAVMEAVVSSTLSHPNIVQVFHYNVTPTAPPLSMSPGPDGALLGSSGGPLGFAPAAPSFPGGCELRLVMEYCEEGSLRAALDCGLLAEPQADGGSASAAAPRLTQLEYVLTLAHDVAVAMLHLHSENMLHGDLKASNVLLARCSGAAAAVPAARPGPDAASSRHRFTAKVSDFGLSLHLGPDATHISSAHGGTVTHMSPELLLEGRASRASDVYSYGILLWELLTGRRAFDGIAGPLLCIKVAKEQWRPSWPPGVCAPLRALAEACWSPSAAARPSFEEVAAYLEGLLQRPELLTQPQPQPQPQPSDTPSEAARGGGGSGPAPA